MVGTSGLGFCQIGSERGQTRWNQEKLLFVSALLLRHLGLLADLANTYSELGERELTADVKSW